MYEKLPYFFSAQFSEKKVCKFQKFIDLIFKSRMPTDDVKDEIIKYVQALETSYTDAIRDLKAIIDKEKKQAKKGDGRKRSWHDSQHILPLQNSEETLGLGFAEGTNSLGHSITFFMST